MNTKKIISTVLTLSLCAAPVCLSASAWKWPWQKESSYEQLLKVKKEWDKAPISEQKNYLDSLSIFAQEISSLKNNTCYCGPNDDVYFNKIDDALVAIQKTAKKAISECEDLIDSFDENNKDEQQCDTLLKKLTELADEATKDCENAEKKLNKVIEELPQAFFNAIKKDAAKILDEHFPNGFPF